jgi:hypothetical protein
MQVNVPTVEMQYHSIVFSAGQSIAFDRQHASILAFAHITSFCSIGHEACLMTF